MGLILLVVFAVVVLLISLLIVVCILLQEDKSGGGIGIIGGSSQSVFGASSGSLFVKITTVLITIFILLILVMALISSSFTKGTVVSNTDIYEAEAKDYEGPIKKMLKNLPENITVSDFDNNILTKLDENDKKLITTAYEKNKNNKYYELIEKKLEKGDKEKILTILNGIGFSLEATAIEFNSTDAEIEVDEDVTND